MSLNELIVAGEVEEPRAVTFWTRGEGSDTVVLNRRPMFAITAKAVTCRLGRPEIAEIAVTFTDTLRIAEFRVKLHGVFEIAPGRERDLILAQARHGGLDIAVREAIREALTAWKGKGDFAGKIFPSKGRNADPRAVQATLDGLRSIGFDIEAARLEPFEWNTDARITLQLGPRAVQAGDHGPALNITARVDLVQDEALTPKVLIAKNATAGEASIGAAVEQHFYHWLEGRYSRHDHTFGIAKITAELRAELDDFCGQHFGRKVALLRFENGLERDIASESQTFDFTADYKIAASSAGVRMTHRCRVVVTDVGRLPGGLSQRQKEVEGRIKIAIQSHILSFSEDRVMAELHTFRGSNVNALSQWALGNPTLGSEIASRGLSLEDIQVFTDEKKIVPDGHTFQHITQCPIRGTKRVLILEHKIQWKVGETREQQSAYVEYGAPAVSVFESEFLAKKLDEETLGQLMAKSFGTIVFEFFQDQEAAETKLSKKLEDALQSFAQKPGVEVSSVTTVFAPVPEARLLRGALIRVEMTPYELADSSDKIELGASVEVRFPEDGDGSLLKQHLSGDDPEQTFKGIADGIREQMEYFMASVEPWEIFSMRSANVGDAESISAHLNTRVEQWLKDNFGLKISRRLVLQIGKCALLEARQKLIGLEDKVEVTTQVLSSRVNLKVATEVGVKVGVSVPYRVAGVDANPKSSRRFMEALRASGGSAEDVKQRIDDIVRGVIAGLMQVLPLEAFIRSNFSMRSFRELIAGLSTYEVHNALGLEISVSPHRVLPLVDSAVISEEAFELQETLRVLTRKLNEERRRLDAEPATIKQLKASIAEIKDELSEVVKEQGVGGTQDIAALADSDDKIDRFIKLRNVPRTALLSYYNSRASAGDAPGDESAQAERVEDDEVAE